MTSTPAATSATPATPATKPRRAKVAKRPSPAARRFGYLVTIAVDVALLVVLHVRPGWEAATFLTDDAAQVVPLVTFSIVVGIVANLVWLVADPTWLRALGDLVTAVIGLVVSVRILTVFPFTFVEGSLWPTVIRVALWVGVVGGAVGAVANLVAFFQGLAARRTA